MGNLFSCAKKPQKEPAVTAAAAPPATTESPTPPSADNRSAAENDEWRIDEAELSELEKKLGQPQPDSP